jgi:glucosyl-dolichyl phosphate glucuronosyltransferase
MNITVVLCTYNRCETLAKALRSVAMSKVPESLGWEVLVVDNNSDDQTWNVVDEYRTEFPGRFRYLFELQPGKSHALNSGIEAARGQLLAFMDDDVIVEPMWLQNLTARLHDGEWAGCGGPILPRWTCSPPSWLPGALAPLALFDIGSQAGPLTESPFGTNMAYRREMFEKYGGFRSDLGPRPGGDIQHSEDTEFGNRLLAAGEHLWYEPSAIVYHPVARDRLEKEYFLAWWFDKSRADVRAYGPPVVSKLRIGGIPVCLFRRLAVWTLLWILAIGESRRFSNKINVWCVAGQVVGCCEAQYNRPQEKDVRNLHINGAAGSAKGHSKANH